MKVDGPVRSYEDEEFALCGFFSANGGKIKD